MEQYLHQTQGRIRIRSKFIRDNQQQVMEQIDDLKKTIGIEGVIHRCHCGSITILFNPKKLSAQTVVTMTQHYGWLHPDKKPDTINHLLQNSAQKFVKGILLGSVKQTLGAPAAFVLGATLGARK